MSSGINAKCKLYLIILITSTNRKLKTYIIFYFIVCKKINYTIAVMVSFNTSYCLSFTKHFVNKTIMVITTVSC